MQDLRETAVPEAVQPMPTTFERAAAAGMAVSVISGAEFTGSGLTRAVLRGGRYVGVHALGDLAAEISAAVAGGGFCYGYHSELDLLGHLYGPGSPAWRMQLRHVDRLVESIVEELPPGGLLTVVADHGMVAVDPARDRRHRQCRNTSRRCVGGRWRAPGTARLRPPRRCGRRGGRVGRDAGRPRLGGRRETRRSRRAGSARGSADTVRPRIGDVVAAARGSAAMVRRAVEPGESALIGHHGSLTPAEQLVPLLVVHR